MPAISAAPAIRRAQDHAPITLSFKCSLRIVPHGGGNPWGIHEFLRPSIPRDSYNLSMTFTDKVVLVTGASKGIGEGCVRVFAEAGAKVVFCARGEKAGRALEKDVNARGPGSALFLPCDVSKIDQVTGVVDQTVKRQGRLDCLINNAGWHPPHKPIDDFTVQEFRDLFELNVVSMFAACQRALPHLRKTKGSIINLSSLVGQMGQ